MEVITMWDFNSGTLKGVLFRQHIIKEFSRQRENAILTSNQQVAVGKQCFCLHKCPCMTGMEEVKYPIRIDSDRPVNWGETKCHQHNHRIRRPGDLILLSWGHQCEEGHLDKTPRPGTISLLFVHTSTSTKRFFWGEQSGVKTEN